MFMEKAGKQETRLLKPEVCSVLLTRRTSGVREWRRRTWNPDFSSFFNEAVWFLLWYPNYVAVSVYILLFSLMCLVRVDFDTLRFWWKTFKSHPPLYSVFLCTRGCVLTCVSTPCIHLLDSGCAFTLLQVSFAICVCVCMAFCLLLYHQSLVFDVGIGLVGSQSCFGVGICRL